MWRCFAFAHSANTDQIIIDLKRRRRSFYIINILSDLRPYYTEQLLLTKNPMVGRAGSSFKVAVNEVQGLKFKVAVCGSALPSRAARLAFPALFFFDDQAQLAAGLAFHGSVFLRPADQVRQYFFDRPIRNIFGYVIACVGKVKANVVAHAQ